MGTEKRRLFLMMVSTFATRNTGIAGVQKFLDKENPNFRRECFAKAEQFVEMSITAIKVAPDNTVGQDEEMICKWLNENIEKRLAERKQSS
jgi:hypothetical protein